LIAIALIAIILAGDIVYLVFVTKLLKESPLGSKPYHAEGVVGNIFSYIAVSLPVVPFVFLLTTAIIGINGMLSSKMFHYFLWSFLIAAFVCFLMATILSGYYMDMSYSFHAPK
jgi:hypothetical protein